jgi:predicted GNAT family acetyltransferase
MSEISYRRATAADLEFVTTAILEAERSGTAHTVYERLFDLTGEELETTVKSMLAEEIPGSELCCESFLLALAADGSPAGAIATWIEAEEGAASNLVRAGLLQHTLGAERWAAARPRLALLREIDVEREAGALQIEAVYVADAHRGRGVTRDLVEHALAETRAHKPGVRKAQILSIEENESSLKAFTRAGFAITRRTRSSNPALRAIFPGAGRLLWERDLGGC